MNEPVTEPSPNAGRLPGASIGTPEQDFGPWWRRAGWALGVAAILGLAAVGGFVAQSATEPDRATAIAVGSVGRPQTPSDDAPTVDGTAVDGSDSADPGSSPTQTALDSDESGTPTARFVSLVDPVTVVESSTDPATGNAAAFTIDDLLAEAEIATQIEAEPGDDGSEPGRLSPGSVSAVVVTITLSGQPESTLTIHPGDRPDLAIPFAIPASGHLIVPVLPVRPDDQGRVVVATTGPSGDSTEGTEMTVKALGLYVETDASAAGRYVHAGIADVGSLVTATDGRDLTIDLDDIASLDRSVVGHVILRMNANVGADGGMVSVLGSEQPDDGRAIVGWRPPSSPSPGLGGTGLAIVPVNEDGTVRVRYLGGSILTVDLVGYFTNDRATVSSSGLLELEPSPQLSATDREPETDPDGQSTMELLIVEGDGGGDGGSAVVTSAAGSSPDRLLLNLAPAQRHTTLLWLDRSTKNITGTGTADHRIWLVGSYRP